MLVKLFDKFCRAIVGDEEWDERLRIDTLPPEQQEAALRDLNLRQDQKFDDWLEGKLRLIFGDSRNSYGRNAEPPRWDDPHDTRHSPEYRERLFIKLIMENTELTPHRVNNREEHEDAIAQAVKRTSWPITSPVTGVPITKERVLTVLAEMSTQERAAITPQFTPEDIERYHRRLEREKEDAAIARSRNAQLDRWDVLDAACGGDLLMNPDKLAAMRRVDNALARGGMTWEYETSFDAEGSVNWFHFHEAVVQEVERVMAMSPRERFTLYQQEKAEYLREESAKFDQDVANGSRREAGRSEAMAFLARFYDQYAKRVASDNFSTVNRYTSEHAQMAVTFD